MNKKIEEKKEIQKKSTSKRGRGRPKSNKASSTIALKKNTAPKLSLEQKQEIKLKRQKEREANKPEEAANKDRFYCTNKELQDELIKWKNSAKNPEDRVMSEELGNMMMAMGNKILNHSNFRGYSKELKEDMRSFGFYKIIKGLKNYNFKFNNPFAWFTQAFFNAYLTIIAKHYKHVNIKRDFMFKLLSDLEGTAGISPNSSINRCIKNYLDSSSVDGDSTED